MPGDLILVYFLQQQDLGSTFKKSRNGWPMHITLVPWFQGDNLAELITTLRKYARTAEPFSIKLGSEQLFNPETRVTIVADKRAIGLLHNDLLSLMLRAGGILRHDRWIQNQYTAHVTHHESQPVPKAGDTYVVNQISLVTLRTGGTCEVVEQFLLGGGKATARAQMDAVHD